MNSDGIFAGIRRVARSRSAQNTTDTSANSEYWLKPASPGRTMMSTPMKPTTIADQRRQPTGSRNITAAPSVIASGSAWKIAEVLASGRCTSAAMNEIVPPISPNSRSATGFCIGVRQRPRRCPDTQANAATSTIANSPRTSITWPKFISDDTALVMESFEVNAAMDTAMSRLPRMFGESANYSNAATSGCAPAFCA